MAGQFLITSSLRPTTDGINPDLSLDEAQKLYAKFAKKDGDDAVRAMADIAQMAKRQQTGWGRLRVAALRELGKFLIRNGRSRGRPATAPSAAQIAQAAKTSDGDVLQTLVSLGITDRHISADAKSVARISQKDINAYLAQEDEPTLAGLRRFAAHMQTGQPQPTGKATFALANMQKGRPPFDANDENSTIEWYTPPEIFEAMETEFDLDVASPGAEIVPWIPAREHWTKSDDSLSRDWRGFLWMNPPYGLRNGVFKWVEKFVLHGNGVALLPDFTSTEWWQTLTARADIILFVRPKIYFLPKREDGRTNSLGSTLVAMGERGVQALRNAERNGRGLCFQRDAGRVMEHRIGRSAVADGVRRMAEAAD